MLSSSHPKIHEPPVTGVSPRPTDQRGARKLRNTRGEDSNGWLLAVLVTAASVQDRDGGHRLVALLQERFSTITLVWADGGYAGRLVAWAAAALALTVTIVKRSDNLRGFVVLPRRGVVERSSVG